MSLSDALKKIISSPPRREDWQSGAKIPWDNPDFSRRMLAEHLSQEHDLASRKAARIRQHVQWLSSHLPDRSGRVLDLCCGPGFYVNQLSKTGLQCCGIDFSPASIAFARTEARKRNLTSRFIHDSVLEADFGTGYDAVMLLFGELNTFNPAQMVQILEKAAAALGHHGKIILEPHKYAAVRKICANPYTEVHLSSGLFSDHPHTLIEQSFWQPEDRASVSRYLVQEDSSSKIRVFHNTIWAYRKSTYQRIFKDCGFADIRFHEYWDSTRELGVRDYFLITLAEPSSFG